MQKSILDYVKIIKTANNNRIKEEKENPICNKKAIKVQQHFDLGVSNIVRCNSCLLVYNSINKEDIKTHKKIHSNEINIPKNSKEVSKNFFLIKNKKVIKNINDILSGYIDTLEEDEEMFAYGIKSIQGVVFVSKLIVTRIYTFEQYRRKGVGLKMLEGIKNYYKLEKYELKFTTLTTGGKKLVQSFLKNN